MHCQRCMSESVSWTCDMSVLVGNVRAHLCVGCLNAFDAMIRETDVWKDRVRHSALSAHFSSLAAAQQPVSFEDWHKLALDENDIQKAAAVISREFIKPLVPAETS